MNATKRAALTIPLLLASGCFSTLTGNEGNFEFYYPADDDILDFNKPLAIGAFLDMEVRDVAEHQPVDLSAASFDDASVLSVLEFADHQLTIEGVGDGGALLSVEGETSGGETLTDSVNMLAATPEVLILNHLCETGDSAYYLTDQRIWVPFELERENGQAIIGYGYYPMTLSSSAASLNESDSNQQWLAFDTGSSAGSADLDSDIDDSVLTMHVAEPADIDGVQDPIAWVLEDIDVGDTNAFFVRPMVGDLAVCQADVAKTVSSDTPEICELRDRDPVDDGSDASYEYGWFEVEGLAQGTCQYTVSYPDAASGAGISEQFSYTIEP